ncbi:hypothetical protein [Sphingobium xenophagum]|uniref:hypothetical protein n=1 Tax=Sphingobium xenophagum TaxID=121428 RepID=UPI0003636C7B|nr:hypothetical protein [Sphingobium xenophagum]
MMVVEDRPTDLINRTAKALRDIADKISEGSLVEPVEFIIPMFDIGSERIATHCRHIIETIGRKQLGVYSIEFDADVPLDRVYDAIDSLKDENVALPKADRTGFAKVNKRKDCEGSRCLYVGKSEKIAERLKEHLHYVHYTTYALHLNRWPSDIPGNLIVKVIGIKGVASSLVTFIEDQIARDTPPILGKRGSV